MSHARIEVRTVSDPAAAIGPAREAVRSLDPDRPIYELMTERQAMAESLDLPRFALTLMTIFGALAVLLAAIGVYGLMAFSVAQRSREIGLRMAVGAGVRDIMANVVGSGVALAGAGLAFGIAGALVLSRYIESMLFGITRLDPATYALVAVVLAATTGLALLGPALRAARVDPSTALRQE
jgi:putative ABC transport system permease protein